MNQVHKETLTHVENAIANRQGLDIEIFGMEGVPAEILDSHNQQVTQKHFAEEAERARVTGNPIRGMFTNGTAAPNKKTKVKENLDELEARADKYRHDKANGLLPVVVPEVAPNPVSIRNFLESTCWQILPRWTLRVYLSARMALFYMHHPLRLATW